MTEPVPSDEQLGAALRKIAEALGQSPKSFAYYSAQFVAWAGNEGFVDILTRSRVHRVRVFVQPPDRLDCVLEHLVEMLVPTPADTADPFEGSPAPDALVVSVERIYSDAVDNRGMTPSIDAQPHWDKILRGVE